MQILIATRNSAAVLLFSYTWAFFVGNQVLTSLAAVNTRHQLNLCHVDEIDTNESWLPHKKNVPRLDSCISEWWCYKLDLYRQTDVYFQALEFGKNVLNIN